MEGVGETYYQKRCGLSLAVAKSAMIAVDKTDTLASGLTFG